jgi:hypothetical protein
MATVTAGVVTPVSGAYGTTPAYSGTFIPTIWSSKLNVKFYTASTFADICNRNWEGDIKNIGDKVIINNIPTLTISDYVVGGNLTYQTPTPNVVEMALDRAKYFGFNVNDVLEYQAKPNLMDMFSNDAAEQMRIVIDSTCIYRSFNEGSSANRGSTAGVKSLAYNLGTEADPIVLNATEGDASNILTKILQMAAVLDEQNVPDSGRWLLLPPRFRTLLMGTRLAQANTMGDDRSMVRNGMIGMIDRFKVYVTNNLPTAAANGTVWISGDGSEQTITATTDTLARTILLAGHTSAISFASQMTKTEQLRNPTDFGDLVRGLNIFGSKVTKPEALALLIAA